MTNKIKINGIDFPIYKTSSEKEFVVITDTDSKPVVVYLEDLQKIKTRTNEKCKTITT